MTAEQLNRILFWTIMAILGFSAWLLYAANKFGDQLAKKQKSAKSVSPLRGVPTPGSGRRGNLKPKRKDRS